MLYYKFARDIIILIVAVGLAVANLCYVGRSDNVWVNIIDIVAFAMCVGAAVYYGNRVVKEAEDLDEMTSDMHHALSSMSDDVSDLNDMIPSDDDIHRISMN